MQPYTWTSKSPGCHIAHSQCVCTRVWGEGPGKVRWGLGAELEGQREDMVAAGFSLPAFPCVPWSVAKCCLAPSVVQGRLHHRAHFTPLWGTSSGGVLSAFFISDLSAQDLQMVYPNRENNFYKIIFINCTLHFRTWITLRA